MKDSEKHPTVEQFMQHYQYAREQTLYSLQASLNNVKQADANDLEERMQKECVGFHTAFVLNLAVNVSASVLSFRSPF